MTSTHAREEGTLRPDQIEDLGFLLREDQKRTGLLHDPAGGKTPTACVFMSYLWSHLGIKTCWAMPSTIIEKNVDELLKWSDFKPEDIYVAWNDIYDDPRIAMLARMAFSGWKYGGRRQIKLIEWLVSQGFVTDIRHQSITEEGLRFLRAQPLPTDFMNAKVIISTFDRFCMDWPHFVGLHPEVNCFIGDEWHKGFASHESERTQQLYRAMRRIDRLVAMTGTLIKGRYDSAYPWIHLVEPRYYMSYDDFYTYHGKFDVDGELVGWENPERLGEIFLKHATRRSFESIHGKEAKIIIREKVRLSDEQRAAYSKLESEALIELEDKFIAANNPGVAAMRARQILQCPEMFGIKGKTGKDEWLELLLDEIKTTGKSLVIFACFDAELRRYEQMCKDFGLRVGFINGTVVGNKRGAVSAQFERRLLDVMVCSMETAGVGLNWGHTDIMAFMSLDYKDDSFIQAYRRGIRGKREKPLRILIPEYTNTVDGRIINVVEQKSAEANAVDRTYQKLDLRHGGETPCEAKVGKLTLADF